MFTGRRILRLELLIPILDHLEKIITNLESGDEQRFWNKMKNFSSTLNKGVKIHTPDGGIVTGTAIDIEHDGGLIVRLDTGENRKFVSGEVEEVEWVQ
jgi:BirA family biotin operon repressor/biotin-[acetyl-CoA-carboxylase] ligase